MWSLHGDDGEKARHRVTDIHSHLLPGIDDGSGSMRESLEMLRIAAEEGITAVIATPHYKRGHRNAGPEKILELTGRVEEAARENGLDIRLYPGNELYYYEGIERELESGNVMPLCGGDHVLIEFSPGESWAYLRGAADRLLWRGYIPVLAHAERYECLLKEAGRVEEYRRMGGEIQINAGTVAGEAGRKAKGFVRGLLREQQVDYVGTDAHGSRGRAPRVRECLKELEKRGYGASYIRRVMRGNAERLIAESRKEQERIKDGYAGDNAGGE